MSKLSCPGRVGVLLKREGAVFILALFKGKDVVVVATSKRWEWCYLSDAEGYLRGAMARRLPPGRRQRNIEGMAELAVVVRKLQRGINGNPCKTLRRSKGYHPPKTITS